jgi:TolB-like protein/Tfp pilus assembly protein PilF
MASLVPEFEYDIFISYRQKDNKGDKWVSEFVEALKIELESTFKEEISVYFDINPHDGLLETYDVDASLKEKLRCLIFIPVISRTYCDPKSFAWQHEFMSFVETTQKDQFGLKVTLPNGYVTNRVLPVRIHDLDPADIRLCESVLGGMLRGVDFVYKSAGVNRPLRVNEDHPQDNLNKTYYRDQINKVANAIDEIFQGLKISGSLTEKEITQSEKNSEAIKSEMVRGNKASIVTLSKKSLVRFILFLSLLLASFISVYIFKFYYKPELRKSVAILPFRCQGNDLALITSSDIITEVALIKLHIVKSLTLRSRISTYQYRDTKKTLNTIRKELNVSYLVEGSMRRDGDKTIIWVGLTDAKHNKQLWSNEYEWDENQISSILSEITRNIASGCNAKILPDELKQIDSDPTKNRTAYLKYISANVISNDAWNISTTGNIVMDSTGFRKAVIDYDNAIEHDSVFAAAYARRAIALSWGYYTGQFDRSSIEKCLKDINKALEIDKDLIDAQIALGFYYYYCDTDYQKALVHFNRAALKDPEDYQPLFYMAMVYRKMGDWGKSQSLISRVIRQNPQVPLFLTNIGLSYSYLHKFDSALIYHQKAIDIMPQWRSPYVNMIDALILKEGTTTKARVVLESASKNTGQRLQDIRILLDIYDGKLKNALNETYDSQPGDFKFKGERYLSMANINSLLNNMKTARIYYDSALVSFYSAGKAEKDAVIRGLISIALAGMGNKDKAIEEVKAASDMATKNVTEESDIKVIQAQVFTMVGDYNNAIINIEYLLDNPSLFSVKLMKLDPVWKPLLNINEVISLIKKYQTNTNL